MTTVADKQTTEESLHQLSFKTLNGEKFDFAQLKGKRVLSS
ncbi:MAG: hypothetical protein U5L96_11410 [Owenweeksia sp.]|nr:hypothetical protein [Owenweeksia sp.]